MEDSAALSSVLKKLITDIDCGYALEKGHMSLLWNIMKPEDNLNSYAVIL